MKLVYIFGILIVIAIIVIIVVTSTSTSTKKCPVQPDLLQSSCPIIVCGKDTDYKWKCQDETTLNYCGDTVKSDMDCKNPTCFFKKSKDFKDLTLGWRCDLTGKELVEKFNGKCKQYTVLDKITNKPTNETIEICLDPMGVPYYPTKMKNKIPIYIPGVNEFINNPPGIIDGNNFLPD